MTRKAGPFGRSAFILYYSDKSYEGNWFYDFVKRNEVCKRTRLGSVQSAITCKNLWFDCIKSGLKLQAISPRQCWSVERGSVVWHSLCYSINNSTMKDSRSVATGADLRSLLFIIRAVRVVPSKSVNVKLYFEPTTTPIKVMRLV